MKRYGNLWPRLVSWENLILASKRAEKGKRWTRAALAFNQRREWELLRLQKELSEGSYQPGPYRTFEVHDTKPRIISAAPYPVRVVHHALCNVLEPIFEKTFIFDTYACRVGKGTHRALDRFTEYARRYRFVLQCDVQKYFPSIDHDILYAMLCRKLKDEKVLALTRRIIAHSNPQQPVLQYFPGDNLFTPHERRRGIPIGNLTSQFFANLYLDGLDHFAKESLKCPGYVRYCDDIAVFYDDKSRLWEIKREMDNYLASLRLRFHERKCTVAPVQCGGDFLGFRVFPDHRRLRRSNADRFIARAKRLQRQYAIAKIGVTDVKQSVGSWIAHASHGDTYRLRSSLLSERVFQRG